MTFAFKVALVKGLLMIVGPLLRSLDGKQLLAAGEALAIANMLAQCSQDIAHAKEVTDWVNNLSDDDVAKQLRKYSSNEPVLPSVSYHHVPDDRTQGVKPGPTSVSRHPPGK